MEIKVVSAEAVHTITLLELLDYSIISINPIISIGTDIVRVWDITIEGIKH